MSELLDEITKLVEPREIKIDKPILGYKNKIQEDTDLVKTDYIYPRLQEFFKENRYSGIFHCTADELGVYRDCSVFLCFTCTRCRIP